MSDALVSLASIQGGDEPYQRAPILFKSRPFEPCENRHAASARKLSIFSQMVGDQSNSTAGRSRSGDRTRSPAPVSRKREYFGVRRETFGISALYSRKGDPRDRCQKRKSPTLAGISFTVRGDFSERRTAWLEREDSNSRIPDRTWSLREFSQIWESGL